MNVTFGNQIYVWRLRNVCNNATVAAQWNPIKAVEKSEILFTASDEIDGPTLSDSCRCCCCCCCCFFFGSDRVASNRRIYQRRTAEVGPKKVKKKQQTNRETKPRDDCEIGEMQGHRSWNTAAVNDCGRPLGRSAIPAEYLDTTDAKDAHKLRTNQAVNEDASSLRLWFVFFFGTISYDSMRVFFNCRLFSFIYRGEENFGFSYYFRRDFIVFDLFSLITPYQYFIHVFSGCFYFVMYSPEF